MHDIPSLHAVTQGAVPAQIANVDLNRHIAAGNAIDPNNLEHARIVARFLRTLLDAGANAAITPAIAESAELRAAAIEGAHVFSAYTPINIAQMLQALQNNLQNGLQNVRQDFQDRLQELNGQINSRFTEVMAVSRNNGIISFNRSTTAQYYRPLRKTAQGHGAALVRHLFTGVQGVPPHHLNDPPQNQIAVVGTTPAFFHNGFSTYTRVDIIKLIVFYNDDFGIVLNENVGQCVNKLHIFLTSF
ncbi:hypothetical protein BD410DRAFT_784980 [Rickenella mellea]|uniref:Uncharacterized protein n=1 Tax=Rickenella mellea TaxID=50990 RepID=A0A4Y7QDI9_9AGAM|nr:hypothetical protein BD410DRAFT_784980 [Rickenella mellea]